MKPINFPEANTVFAKDQPPYRPLPADVRADGAVTTCWRASWRERLSILLTGRVWLRVLTFGNPLQPVKLTAQKPPDLVSSRKAERALA